MNGKQSRMRGLRQPAGPLLAMLSIAVGAVGLFMGSEQWGMTLVSFFPTVIGGIALGAWATRERLRDG